MQAAPHKNKRKVFPETGGLYGQRDFQTIRGRDAGFAAGEDSDFFLRLFIFCGKFKLFCARDAADYGPADFGARFLFRYRASQRWNSGWRECLGSRSFLFQS
jgi:hypothetical protein